MEKEPVQDTVIVVSVGWCGGMGEAVLKPPDFTSIAYHEDLPIFIEPDVIQDFVEQHFVQSDNRTGPLPHEHGPLRILIKGLIRLVRKTEACPSVPGQPLTTFWEAEIERLDRMEIFYGPGEEETSSQCIGKDGSNMSKGVQNSP
jgi:hypothetical protein